MTQTVTRSNAEWLTLVPMKDLPAGLLGAPAGLFFAGMQLTGDASGGIVRIAGSLSFSRKQEYVYEWQGTNVFTDDFLSDGDDAELTLSTGPQIPDPSGIFINPSYRELRVGAGNSAIGNTVWDFELGNKGKKPVVVYGDKNIAGAFDMAVINFGVNDLAVSYFFFGWGLYYRYQTVFRGIPLGVG